MMNTKINFTYDPVDVPVARTLGERNALPAARRARATYAKERQRARAMNRPFIGWDGEGVTRDDGAHDYVLLASSAGDVITNPAGLDTVTILDTVLNRAATGNAIHVIYGGGYDFNKWLKDLTRDDIEKLYAERYARWGQYLLSWRRGKSLSISHPSTGRKVIVYDVVSFFQCSFVKACDSYLGDRFTHRDLIVENKATRSVFNLDDLDTIITYNNAELDNLVKLCDELRERLDAVGLRPPRWDGPGAIAATLLKREDIHDHMQGMDHRSHQPEAARAARFAYAGGRFEVLKFGDVDAPAYEYDINSAYPAALRTVPDLSVGRWHYRPGDPGDLAFAIYHARFSGQSSDWRLPHPLFRRSRLGNICYPQDVEGWWWSPDIHVTRQWCNITGGTLDIDGVWEWVPDNPDARPFAFIDALYEQRRALKAAGNGAHVGIKLGLNSLYGKLAQQVGWQSGPPMKTPPFHQLEWAGYVTATARSQVLSASLPHLEHIIAYETDAVFSTVPLDVQCGNNLGDWEYTVFDSLTYLQSGFYFGTLTDGTEIAKTRGVDRGTFTRQQARDGLAQPLATDRVGHAQLTRFIGAGLALAQDWDRWGRWETLPKNIQLTPQGKRTHEYGCENCDPSSTGETLGVWHSTICPHLDPALITSHEFPVEWINPNPAMNAAILRETASEDKSGIFHDD